MRDSTNTDPIFLSIPPDWARAAKIEALHETPVFPSRAGYEQRQRVRKYGRYRITFQRCGYTREEWSSRWTRVRAEHQSIVILPFWTEGSEAKRLMEPQYLGATLEDEIIPGAGDHLIVGRYAYRMAYPLRAEWWQDRRYAYLWNGTEGRFQEILAVSSDGIRTLRSTHRGSILATATRRLIMRRERARVVLMPPANDLLGEMDTCRMFPCVPCRRVRDADDQTGASLESYDETLMFETL